MLSGKDFLVTDLYKNQLDTLCKYFSKHMIAFSLELATGIIAEQDKKDPEKIKKINYQNL